MRQLLECKFADAERLARRLRGASEMARDIAASPVWVNAVYKACIVATVVQCVHMQGKISYLENE